MRLKLTLDKIAPFVIFISLMTTSGVLARPVKYPRGKHPNTLASLRPYAYQKGQNGHGRVYPLKERLRHALDHPLKEPPPDAPHGDQIVYATLKGAQELVPVAFRETWDRTEGKVPGDGVQVNFNEIKILVVYEERKKPELET